MSNKDSNKKSWRLTSFNPLNGDILGSNEYRTIKELSTQNPKIKEDIWRNISIGRSKVYQPFFKLEHIKI